MSWVAVATIGGAVVGAASSASSARKATKASSKAATAELDFAKQQYEDWMDTFGDIQSNLADYYENLTPAFIETQALQAFEQEKEIAMRDLEADLAQRGIERSGIAADIEKDVALQSATERARIRAEAPIKAAEAQREFLQIGLGQNPAQSVQSALAGQTSRAQQESLLATQAAGRATGAAIDTTFDQLTKLLQRDSVDSGITGVPLGNPNDSVGGIA